MRVTVLGMGNMGRAFAARAIETGYQTTVWNRTPGRVADLVASGAIESNTSTEAVAGADAVLVVLADDAAVLDVCLGDNGVLASLEPDAVFADRHRLAGDCPTTCRAWDLRVESLTRSGDGIAGDDCRGNGEISHRRPHNSDFRH